MKSALMLIGDTGIFKNHIIIIVIIKESGKVFDIWLSGYGGS